MCGICGMIDEDRTLLTTAITAMTWAMNHRGPDDWGQAYFHTPERTLGFGFRRLSILDLSGTGHQPMFHPQSGDCLIFNGEIYGHQQLRNELEHLGEKFVGTSDTEVLLHALTRWGTEALSRIHGMYGLAFYEARKQRLLLARDPMGIKPLYFAASPGRLLFASEVRALVASGVVTPDLDRGGIASLLAYGAVQAPRTIFRDIREFPPGAWQWFDINNARPAASPTRFWQIPGPDSSLVREAELLPRIRQIMETAVKEHLVSDVPVGVFLSSGLDSTVVAALAAKCSRQLRSFTVGFSDEPDMSELTLARRTAQCFGLMHIEIDISSNQALELTNHWLESIDQPSMDGLNVYIISKVVRDAGITVALSGQGGDELFGGYLLSFRDLPRIFAWMKRLRLLPTSLRRPLAALAGMGRSQASAEKIREILTSNGHLLDLYLHRRRAMSNRQMHELGLDPAALGLTANYIPEEALSTPVREDDPIWSLSALESRMYQGNMLLRDGDANSMASSLELRVPMLDQRLANLMFSIPGPVRVPRGQTKHLIRRAFADLLRAELLSQGKRGFTLPIRRWMLGPLRDRCNQSIAKLKESGLVTPHGVQDIWNSFEQQPESPIWSRAMTLVVLGNYLGRVNSMKAPPNLTRPEPERGTATNS